MPAEAPLQFPDFKRLHLDPLVAAGQGGEALHVMTYPNAYPPDQDFHDFLKNRAALPEDLPKNPPEAVLQGVAGYRHVMGELTRGGIALHKLRVLPDALNDDVPALIEATRLFTAPEEETRVCLFSEQVGRLALQAGMANVARELQQAAVPRKGLWSVRHGHSRALDRDRPAVIGLMDYDPSDKRYLGIEVHRDPTTALLHYERFWRQDVFNNPDASVPLEAWEDLYTD